MVGQQAFSLGRFGFESGVFLALSVYLAFLPSRPRRFFVISYDWTTAHKKYWYIASAFFRLPRPDRGQGELGCGLGSVASPESLLRLGPCVEGRVLPL